jgi:hypothetical protein
LLLLPFVSPSRDGKNQASRFETRTSHRDEPGGLFIGASILAFALMNSAPAELLHPLVYAALQPNWLWHVSQRCCGRNQKNAGHNAGIGILFQK